MPKAITDVIVKEFLKCHRDKERKMVEEWQRFHPETRLSAIEEVLQSHAVINKRMFYEFVTSHWEVRQEIADWEAKRGKKKK